MAYTINFTDQANNGSITIEDGIINSETDLNLPGRNSTGYGSAISENFLHLLENFNSGTEPSRPVEGQLWYDSNENVLKVYNGTNWVASGGLKRATAAPDTGTAILGDLWVDTDNQQLYLFSGSNWVLVGPSFSEGLSTGPQPVELVGQDDVTYTTLQIQVNSQIIAIISKDTFTPKATIAGFQERTIQPGINLSNTTKFYGTAEKAENLIVGNNSVAAANFLRGDVESTTTFPIRVQNNEGISYGINNELSVGVEGQAGLIQHQVEGSSIDIRVKKDGSSQTAIRIDSDLKVGIANLAPEEALDVTGNIKASGILKIQDVTDSTNISDGSAIIKGGAGIAKNLFVGENISVSKNITLGNTNLLVDTAESDLVLPDSNNTRNIGRSTLKWRNIYATTFKGNLEGNVSGSVSGSSGTSDKLTSATLFKITGDVEDVTQRFDGQTQFEGDFGAGTKEFNLQIKNTIISNKTNTSSSNSDDEVLVNRVTGDTGLKKMSRNTLFSAIQGLMPVGSVLPFAGSAVPPGFLLCDGSEVDTAVYSKLEAVIGNTYNNNPAAGKFGLPDLRGRFLAGLLGTATGDNRITTGTGINNLGAIDGQQSVTIGVNNLPEHSHDMKDSENNQFFAVREQDTGDTLPSGVQRSTFSVGSFASQKLPSSGGVVGDTGDALNVVNPFMAMNFIIYAGTD